MLDKKFQNLLLKSAAASLLIGLGDFVLLKIGNPLGPVFFSFGLLGVCVLGLKLFTGRCGFLFEDKVPLSELAIVLLVNLIFGYFLGFLFSVADPGVIEAAQGKVDSWSLSLSFFLKSLFCGMIMYLAVKLYKKGTNLGVLLGVPLFIFSGFQHSIANVITLGVSVRFSGLYLGIILLCALGNFLGALVAYFFTAPYLDPVKKKKLHKIKA